MRPRLKLKRVDQKEFTRHGRLWLYAVGFAVIGAAIVLLTRAAPTAIATEPENGTASGLAQQFIDGNASGGKAIRFGGQQDAGMKPTLLRGYTGGDSIAIRWRAIDSQYGPAKYRVYRNNVQIAIIDAATAPQRRYEQPGTSYIDKAVSPGVSYTYNVLADANGKLSPFSDGITLTHPQSTTPVPTINVTLNGATGLSTYVANAADYLKTWYPKAVDSMVRGGYTVPTTLTINIDTASGADCAGYVVLGTSTINVCQSYAAGNQDDMSLFTHEMTHVIQAYTAPALSPLTLEGLASWFSDNTTGYIQPLPPETEDYESGYGYGSYFISWLMNTYNLPNLPRVMNVSAHNVGKQAGETIQQMTNKSPN